MDLVNGQLLGSHIMRVGDRIFLRGKLDAQGRLLVPAEIREALGARPGDVMALKYEDGELKVITFAENLRRIQEEASKYAVPGRSAVDDLLAERRAEVEQEEAEARERRRRLGIPEPTPEELERRAEASREYLKKWAEEYRRRNA